MRLKKRSCLLMLSMLVMSGCVRRDVAIQEDLLLGSAEGDAVSVKGALAAGADPNVIPPSFTDTPLYMAVSNDRREIIQLLIDAGANPAKAGRNGSALSVVRNQEVKGILEKRIRWNGNPGGP